MTSATFAVVPISSILINREGRQRRELEGVEELAASIRALGLINPITIDRAHNLIAGETRLAACKYLGWSDITVQFIEDLSPFLRRRIELEENVRRTDLPWPDYVKAVAEMHELYKAESPEWTATETADALNVSASHIHQVLLVHRNLDNELVKNADKFSVARNAASRYEERRTAQATRTLGDDIADVLGIQDPGRDPAGADQPRGEDNAPLPPRLAGEIVNGNFLDFARDYRGPAFNLIHCDFPYGVGIGDKIGQSAAKHTGTYADTPDIYFELLEALCTTSLVAESAHLVFWFSMDFYQRTLDRLTAAGWIVNPFPLIWHKSDNAGILPDPNRGPRRTYETALFASRGDRKIVRAVANSVAAATTRELHTSEKPMAVVNHFLRMLVDDTTRMLDPTAGSGNAVRASIELGATYSLGLELNPDFAAAAQENLEGARVLL